MKKNKKAQKGEITLDCRDDKCTGCGICDFKKIQPVINPEKGDIEKPDQVVSEKDIDRNDENEFQKYKIFYSKLGSVRHLGHLEFAKIIRRAIRKAGFCVKYTKGFNPNIKLSFDNPLPVGMESEQEFFILFVDKSLQKGQIKSKLNKALPFGITITDLSVFSKKDLIFDDIAKYSIKFKDHAFKQENIDEFMNCSEWLEQGFTKKGKKKVTDLRRTVADIKLIDSADIEMKLQKYKDKTVRPSEILLKCFKIPEEVVQAAKIVKLKQEF